MEWLLKSGIARNGRLRFKSLTLRYTSFLVFFRRNMKEYKTNPDAYKGSVADVSTVIRVATTTSSMTPDLYEILRLLGKERIEKRFQKFM